MKPDRILRPKEVCARLGGCARTTLWRWEREIPNFPKKVRLSSKSVGFSERQVEEYIASLPHATVEDAAA